MSINLALSAKPLKRSWLRNTLIAILLLSGSQAGASCMVISLQEKNDRILLQSGEDAMEVESRRPVKMISKEFRQIYEILEKNKKLDERFDARLKGLSQELFGPLIPAMRQASCIVFNIQPRFMHFTLDLLPIDGEPLFVEKAIAFSFGAPKDQDQIPGFGAESRGLILRDPETDPDNGAGEVRAYYPESNLYAAKSAGPKLFAKANADFLLISAHGFVVPGFGANDGDKDDSVLLKEHMNADEFGDAKFRLVYFDSCQLGLSKPFIDAASRSGAHHYLAPIISNESGNSSTLTMRYFFTGLNQGQSSMDALFSARKRIYHDSRANSRSDQIFYSYPFRLYLL